MSKLKGKKNLRKQGIKKIIKKKIAVLVLARITIYQKLQFVLNSFSFQK